MIKHNMVTGVGELKYLTGVGLEQLVDPVTGEVMARFYNGSLTTIYIAGTEGQQTVVTKEAA